MKLFTQTEVITNKDKQVYLDIKRTADVKKELDSKRRELDKLEIEFAFTLAKQQAQWEKEKGENMVTINTLKKKLMF